MWYDILKVQVLGGKQKVKMGNIPIPVEDENPCRERFTEIYNKLAAKGAKYSISTMERDGDITWGKYISEEECCIFIDLMKSYADSMGVQGNMVFDENGILSDISKLSPYKTLRGMTVTMNKMDRSDYTESRFDLHIRLSRSEDIVWMMWLRNPHYEDMFYIKDLFRGL